MAVTIKHAKTDNIADWTQPDLDAQIALGNFPPGTLLADIVLPSDWNNDHNLTGTVPVANGGTGVTSSSGANSVVIRDANANITTNCLFEGFTSQAASGTPIVLTASSVQNFQITGSGGQTIRLPDATTLPNGALFTFNNNQSSGTVIVQNNSSTTVDTLQSGAFSTVVLLDNSTAAGSWDRHNQTPANVSWSTNTFDYPGSITSATWNGNAIALNRGGTNANLTAVNGGSVYSTGTALAITAAGTAGQVLQSNGAAAPTWASFTSTAAGSTTQVQYNNSGVFAGSANFTFNGTTVTTANDASISGLTVGKGVGAVATNTAVGFQAINATATGTSNTALGYQALTANTSGGSNTSVGHNSLIRNTTGTSNTALGQAALQNNTTNVATLGSITGGSGYTTGTYTGVVMTLSSGSTAITYPTATIVVAGGAVTTVTITSAGVGFKDTTTVLTAPSASIGGTGSGFTVPVATLATGGNNTAVGYQALLANTTASQNVAVGQGALVANTTGDLNTAIGSGAGASVVTGRLNTFVGQGSGSNVVGSRGVYVGYQAGFYATNTGATYNTAVGTFALFSTASSTGLSNTALGAFSLYTTTTGNQNTGVGYQAGYSITSGTNNTLLGYAAANSGTNNLTTGSNNTIIGYNAEASSATVSNEITLGNASVTSLRLAPLITGYTSAAPTVASAATIAPTKPISFVSGTTTINTITAPAPISAGGGSITLIPTGIFTTGTSGNIAIASTAIVSRALIMTYDATTTKWYPSY